MFWAKIVPGMFSRSSGLINRKTQFIENSQIIHRFSNDSLKIHIISNDSLKIHRISNYSLKIHNFLKKLKNNSFEYNSVIQRFIMRMDDETDASEPVRVKFGS